VSEVYTLDAALLSAMVLFLLRWDGSREPRDLAFAVLFFGLSLTNRTSNLLALPALAIFVAPAWRTDRRALIGASLAAMPPLALYALLPLRSLFDRPYRWGSSYGIDGEPRMVDLTQPTNLLWYVSGRAFNDLLWLYTPLDRLRETGAFVADAWQAFLGGGVIIAAVGAATLAVQQRRTAVMLGVLASLQAIFFINYGAADKDTMFIVVYVVGAIFAGVGVARIVALAESQQLPAAAPLALMLAAACALLLVRTNAPLVDLSDDYRARDEARALLAVADDNALVVGRWTDVAPLEYLQAVEGERNDLDVVHQWATSDRELRALASTALERGRTVYVFRREPAFRRHFWFNPVGDWFELKAVPNKEGGED
jgi:hypothetical protein